MLSYLGPDRPDECQHHYNRQDETKRGYLTVEASTVSRSCVLTSSSDRESKCEACHEERHVRVIRADNSKLSDKQVGQANIRISG